MRKINAQRRGGRQRSKVRAMNTRRERWYLTYMKINASRKPKGGDARWWNNGRGWASTVEYLTETHVELRFMNKIALSVGVLAAGVVLTGCSPPKGEGTGRVEPTDTTKAERYSPQLSITGLTEQADQTAELLAADLKSIPELNQGFRSTVVFGDIVNKTQIVPTSDFEAFRTKIRNRLMQSQMLRNQIRWVENRARVEQLRAREGAGRPQDLLQEGAPAGGVAPLNEAYTYFLNGEMYRVDRGNSTINLYSMSYNLTSMATGEIIWTSPSYEIKQIRN